MASSSPLRGRSILLVEDEPLIAIDLVEVLTRAGAEVLSAHNTAAVAKLLKVTRVSAALLDFRLGPGDCLGICALLRQYGVPYGFHTAYASVAEMFPGAEVIVKPARADRIVASLAKLMA